MANLMWVSVLYLLLLIFFLISRTSHAAGKEPQVPCFFVFGDSRVDNGNNNGLQTQSKADFWPYGIDFPQGTTGRFTNGRTFVDVLTQLLGFPNYIPPYATTDDQALLLGVNYASGAAGIRDETGYHFGDRLSMKLQVENFAMTVQKLNKKFSNGDLKALGNYLSKCIFYSGMGSNDYFNNYFMPDLYITASLYTPKAYADALLQQYTDQLMELYKLGARKIVVTAVGPVGCIPFELARHIGNSSSRCNQDINSAIKLFNSGLEKMVERFNKLGKLPEAKFVFLDTFRSFNDIILNPKTYGFEQVEEACFRVHQKPCDDRKKYVFWDVYHPTEAVNIILARKSYASKSKLYANPINMQQLATSSGHS